MVSSRGLGDVYKRQMTGKLVDSMQPERMAMTATLDEREQEGFEQDCADFRNSAPIVLKFVTGVLALARDKTLVTPVIMNRHRRENMTGEEVARYAAAAIKTTQRIGFDVGRDMERRKSSEHYRNGHFARFHVKVGHPMYPPGHSGVSAIVKWRSGCVVNKGNVPEVPTGFHDREELPAE